MPSSSTAVTVSATATQGGYDRGNRADRIGKQVRGRDHEAGRFAARPARRADRRAARRASASDPGDKGDGVRRFDQIERGATHGEHREGADAARARLPLAFVGLFESKPHEHSKPDRERKASGEFKGPR